MTDKKTQWSSKLYLSARRTKKISVLLPVLNGEKTLTAAVRSTLSALGPLDEILVLIQGVDASGYDFSFSSDSRVKIYFQTSAHGIAGALNFLAHKAEGEFIARMDQDDICLKSRFRAQVRYLEKHDLDFVFANAILFGRQVAPFRLLPQLPLPLPPSSAPLFLLTKNPFVHPTMLAKRSALQSIGFYRNSIAEDYDLWARAACHGLRLARMARYAVMYRIHPGQLSRSLDFDLRVENDALLRDSLFSLRTSLFPKRQFVSNLELQNEVERLLTRDSIALSVIWSPLGRRFLAFGNFLIGNGKMRM